MRLAWWLVAVVAVSLIGFSLSEQHVLDPVQNLSLTVTAPVEGGLRDVASPASDLFSGIIYRGDLTRENRELKQEIERLNVQIAQQQDIAQRVKELEAALGVKQSRPDDQLLGGNVIAEETSGLKRAVAIDRGLGDGIDEGMVVLSRNGSLIGTVSRAYQDFAWIRLITDPDSTVNAQISVGATLREAGASQAATPAAPATAAPATSPQPSDAAPVSGIARGDLRRGIVLNLVPSDAPIVRGGLVVTSGHGRNYPRGLLIGTVGEIEQRPQSPFQTASVEPAANLSGLDTVLVLISFKPARLSGP